MREVLVQVGVQVRLEDVVECRLLRFFLGLERFGIVQHFAVAIAEDVRRIPAVDAEQPRLEARRDDRLDQRLARLHVLAGDRRLGMRGQLDQRGNVGGQVRGGVGVRNALADGSVGVHHARRNRRVVRLEPALEARHRLVHFALGHVDLGAAGPNHDQPVEIVVLLEFLDVRHDLFRQVALGLALLDVGTFEPLDVVLVEDRRPRANLLELRPHLLEQRRLQNAGRFCRAVAVLREDVPAAEDEIVEGGQRHDLVDQGRTAFRPLSQTDMTHLGQRADGLGNSFANGDDAGDEGRADGPEADQKHAEFAARGSNVNRSRHK